MRTWTMLAAAVLVGGGAYLVNPGYLFSGGFGYDAADMRAAVTGTWELTLDGRVTTLAITQGGAADLHAARASLVRDAAACGTRSLVASADACKDVSQMPLHVAVVRGRGVDPGADPGPVTGSFSVVSTEFRTGRLELALAAAPLVVAQIAPDGRVESVEVAGAAPGPYPAAGLVRVAPTPAL